MKIISDFKQLPMLYAKHFNRHAVLACVFTTEPDIAGLRYCLLCRAIRLAGSQYDELPFFGPQSFRLNGTPPEDVTMLDSTTIAITYETEAWPLMVQYIGSETTHFVIPEAFQYQPGENRSMKLRPVYRFFRFVPPVGHFYTISQEEADGIINGIATDEWERPLNQTFRYEGVAFYAVHPHDYEEA